MGTVLIIKRDSEESKRVINNAKPPGCNNLRGMGLNGGGSFLVKFLHKLISEVVT